jgi:hypothetical protein
LFNVIECDGGLIGCLCDFLGLAEQNGASQTFIRQTARSAQGASVTSLWQYHPAALAPRFAFKLFNHVHAGAFLWCCCAFSSVKILTMNDMRRMFYKGGSWTATLYNRMRTAASRKG